MLKKLMMVLFISALVVSLSACNTWRGLGKDVESGGEAMQKSGR